MTRIYPLSKPPAPVRNWFSKNFPHCTYKFYTYMTKKIDGQKIYACEVYLDGRYYHNATQAPLDWYIANA